MKSARAEGEDSWNACSAGYPGAGSPACPALPCTLPVASRCRGARTFPQSVPGLGITWTIRKVSNTSALSNSRFIGNGWPLKTGAGVEGGNGLTLPSGLVESSRVCGLLGFAIAARVRYSSPIVLQFAKGNT